MLKKVRILGVKFMQAVEKHVDRVYKGHPETSPGFSLSHVSWETYWYILILMHARLRNIDIGTIGESLASRYLKEHGFDILLRNYAISGVGEIDILAYKDETLYFVEVKTSEDRAITSEYHAVAHFDVQKKKNSLKTMRKFCSLKDVSMRRTLSLLTVSFSRETLKAQILFEPFIVIDTI